MVERGGHPYSPTRNPAVDIAEMKKDIKYLEKGLDEINHRLDLVFNELKERDDALAQRERERQQAERTNRTRLNQFMITVILGLLSILWAYRFFIVNNPPIIGG